MGVPNQPVQHGLAKGVVTDHVVPVFNRPPGEHSACRIYRPVAPVDSVSVMTTLAP
jgi:hypothetical protein